MIAFPREPTVRFGHRLELPEVLKDEVGKAPVGLRHLARLGATAIAGNLKGTIIEDSFSMPPLEYLLAGKLLTAQYEASLIRHGGEVAAERAAAGVATLLAVRTASGVLGPDTQESSKKFVATSVYGNSRMVERVFSTKLPVTLVGAEVHYDRRDTSGLQLSVVVGRQNVARFVQINAGLVSAPPGPEALDHNLWYGITMMEGEHGVSEGVTGRDTDPAAVARMSVAISHVMRVGP